MRWQSRVSQIDDLAERRSYVSHYQQVTKSSVHRVENSITKPTNW